MTKRQLELLKMLPDITDAMRAYVEEAKEFHSVMMQMPGMEQQRPQVRNPNIPQSTQYAPTPTPQIAPPHQPLIHTPVINGHAVLDTPERREYIAARAAEANGKPPEGPLPHLEAKRRERELFLQSMRGGSGLMEQFERNSSTGQLRDGAAPAGQLQETVKAVEPLSNMPVATGPWKEGQPPPDRSE